jgi:hypothetical protein
MKFLVTLVLDVASRHKKTCIPVARLGKAKARGQCMVALPPSRKAKRKLYVALSRGVSRQIIRILAKPKKKLDPTGKSTKNIIYNNVMDW